MTFWVSVFHSDTSTRFPNNSDEMHSVLTLTLGDFTTKLIYEQLKCVKSHVYIPEFYVQIKLPNYVGSFGH